MLEDGGVYVFHLVSNPLKVLDVYGGGKQNGTNIQVFDYHYAANQRFQALKRGDYYMFKDLNSGKMIDVNGGQAKNQVNIQLYEQNNSDSQKWKVIDLGKGRCSFQSKLNSKFYMDIKNGETHNENNVWLFEGNNSNAQKFIPAKKILYKYRVGVKGLFDSNQLKKFDITHAAFLIGTDLFEYGTDKFLAFHVAAHYGGIDTNSQGFVRIKAYNRNKRDEPFDWDRLGNKLNGTTWLQPDELEYLLIKSNNWLNSNYNVLIHNCQDFVRECLLLAGANQGETLKLLPIFRPH